MYVCIYRKRGSKRGAEFEYRRQNRGVGGVVEGLDSGYLLSK